MFDRGHGRGFGSRAAVNYDPHVHVCRWHWCYMARPIAVRKLLAGSNVSDSYSYIDCICVALRKGNVTTHARRFSCFCSDAVQQVQQKTPRLAMSCRIFVHVLSPWNYSVPARGQYNIEWWLSRHLKSARPYGPSERTRVLSLSSRHDCLLSQTENPPALHWFFFSCP